MRCPCFPSSLAALHISVVTLCPNLAQLHSVPIAVCVAETNLCCRGMPAKCKRKGSKELELQGGPMLASGNAEHVDAQTPGSNVCCSLSTSPSLFGTALLALKCYTDECRGVNRIDPISPAKPPGFYLRQNWIFQFLL